MAFWRFVNNGGSNFEALLSRDPPPTLEDLLDDDELLTECKTQNSKLIDFLGRPESVKSLLGWVVKGLETGETRGRETEEEKKRRSRFPALATEVLCSDLWVITETALNPSCFSSSDHQPADLMRPFWDAVLGPPPSPPSANSIATNGESPSNGEGEKKEESSAEQKDEFEVLSDGQEIVYGMWARVNSVFLGKKTHEMLAFVKSQPAILERLLAKIDSPAIVDLLFRIIQCEDLPAGQGIIDWLSTESLIPRLTALLSPQHYTTHHETATDLLKGIITMSAPAPGPFNPNAGANGNGEEGGGEGSGGLRNNKFARELVAETTVERLVSYMLDNLDSSSSTTTSADHGTIPSSSLSSSSTLSPEDFGLASTSSLTSAISIFIELIRKNNSDYSEPHLFHTLRNGLMHHSSAAVMANAGKGGEEKPDPAAVEGETEAEKEERKDNEDREKMENAMESINERMGIVHLGSLLTVLSNRLERFQQLIKKPRTNIDSSPTTAGSSPPLTLERFRIVELYAELLHCSNMAIVNRAPGFGPRYDEDGRLLGGLDGLDKLSDALENGEAADADGKGEEEVVFQSAKELPISASGSRTSEDGEDEEAEVGKGEDDAEMVEVPVDDEEIELKTPTSPTAPASSIPLPDDSTSPKPSAPAPPSSAATETPASTSNPSNGSLPETSATEFSSIPSSSPLLSSLAPGDLLKQQFIDHNLLPTLLDLFFAFPLNNFLHNVVYDILQQVLSGSLDPGLNRDLIVSLFDKGRLIEQILHGQKLSDAMKSRQGYMGHLILIAEDIIKFFSRSSPELLTLLEPHYTRSEWDAFVDGPYREAKERDNTNMGGGKPRDPAMSMGEDGGMMGMDGSGVEVESDSDEEEDQDVGSSRRRGFGVASSGGVNGDGDNGATTEQFSRYLAQQMTSGASDRQFESSSDDEDEDDADWIGENQGGTSPFATMRRDPPNGGASGSGAGGDASRLTRSTTIFGSSFDDDDDDAWGTFQSTPSSTANNTSFSSSTSSDDPFGDDFASPADNNPNTEALAALSWDDASFQSEFRDVDSDSDGSDIGSSFRSGGGGGSGKIAIPDHFDSDEEDAGLSTTPTGKNGGWGSFGGGFSSKGSGGGATDAFGMPSSSSSSSSTSLSTSPTASTSIPFSSHSSASTSPLSIPPRSSAAATSHHTRRRSSSSHSSPSSSPSTSPSNGPPNILSSSPSATLLPPGARLIFQSMASAISPPDPALLATVTADEPFGPGVSEDTVSVDSDETAGGGGGFLTKIGEDGERITVPKDEIALAVGTQVKAASRWEKKKGEESG